MINSTGKLQKYWIYSIVILFPIFFRTSETGVSLLDVFFAVYFFGSLIIWFFWKIFLSKTPLILNTADFFLILFFLLAIGSMVLSVVNGVQFLDVVREYILLSFVLYYFPFRENLRDKKILITFGILFSFAMFLNDFGQFYDYYREIQSGIRYAYQIITGTKTNQTIYTFTILTGILFFLYPQRKISRIWLILLIGLTALALITTASRTFWVIVLFSILIFLFIIPWKHKALLLISSIFATILIILSINLYFGDKTEIVYKAIELRLSSSTQGTKDISLEERLQEYRQVIRKIKENPIAGNGFSKKFTFYSLINEISVHPKYIHNSFLYFTYRLGIPLAFMYFYVFFYFLGKSLKLIIQTKDLLYQFIVISGFIGLFILLFSSLTSAQFMDRDGIFVMAISYALIETTFSFNKKENIASSEIPEIIPEEKL